MNNYYNNYLLDIIDTRIYKSKQIVPKKTHKHICIDNEALEAIPLPKIFNPPDIIKTLTYNLQQKETIPTVTYKLSNNMRNNTLNCKDAVHSIYIDEEVSFSLNTDLCECEKSNYCDPHHKHIITGQLRIIENKKLGKFLSKSANYRDSRSIKFSKAFIEIGQAFETCIEKISTKNKLEA